MLVFVRSTWIFSMLIYLSPRRGQVVIQGAFSDEFEIANSVFQGTVLGPPLWNSFFSDVSLPATSTGGKGQMFADDLNVFQTFDRNEPLDKCKDILNQCKNKVHKWGGDKPSFIRCHERAYDCDASFWESWLLLQASRVHDRCWLAYAFCSRTSSL